MRPQGENFWWDRNKGKIEVWGRVAEGWKGVTTKPFG
jgi:hypothetical protein